MAVTSNRLIATAAACLLLSLLMGCTDGGNLLDRSDLRGEADSEPQAAAGETVEVDVEAPDVFSVTGEGLWDGRPSLGGIWVAHPDVDEPERVAIRNLANGRSVVGALFRRERDMPGPVLQVSSDAAEALGLVAGSPQEMEAVALRRREVPVEAPVTAAADPVTTPEEVIETTLDPVAIANDANYSNPESGAGAAGTE